MKSLVRAAAGSVLGAFWGIPDSEEVTLTPAVLRGHVPLSTQDAARGERERETFFLFRLCEQATYIIRAQDTVTALLQVQTGEGVGQLGGLKEL